MIRSFAFTLVFLILASTIVYGQEYELKTSSEIYQHLKKLEKGMRVLYVAAHPDDENTRLIAWLENDQHIETAYLSLTRGQGGQNLIGDEKGDGLGVIRTYELLEARKVDGGEQMFTRAVDFGYSKSAEESFEKWGKAEVLGDVVYGIRKFRPHIIITRFPPNRYAGHGHHEASAILAEEAFDLAADPNAYPEQLKWVDTWQPQLMFFNTSSWWRKELEDKTAAELKEEKIHRVNIGVFNALTGLGINETAALARSKHRCQAFGTDRDRGERFEYLKQLKGEWNDVLFGDVEGIWMNSPEHQQAFTKVVEQYDFTDMEHNLQLINDLIEPKLAQRNMWAEGKDIGYVTTLIDRIKQNLMGIRIEAFSDQDPIVVGTDYPITIQVYNAHENEAMVRFTHEKIDTTVIVAGGSQIEWTETLTAPDLPSTPYWLRNEHDWLYDVPLSEQSALPRLTDELISYSIRGKGRSAGATELHRKWRDRSIGEVIQPMRFAPLVGLSPESETIILRSGNAQTRRLDAIAFGEVKQLSEVSLSGDDVEFQAKGLSKGQQTSFDFKVSSESENGQKHSVNVGVKGSTESGEVSYFDQSFQLISYEHIPEIQIVKDCKINVITVDLKESSGRILYLDGSGDEVDDALIRMGYSVESGALAGKTAADLSKYNAIVCGIRSVNKNNDLANNIELLHQYAENGGNVIMQYNTSYGLLVEQFSPYSLSISRNRVTEEDSEVRILDSKHRVFNEPNKITLADFDSWVQERGLYLAGEWGEEYTALIAWHDKGEEDVLGGLLIASHGKGSFIYTGISFFRQLPAGVSGAYRLFDNLIQYKP